MFRAIFLAAVISTCSSQSFKNFFKDSGFSSRQVSRFPPTQNSGYSSASEARSFHSKSDTWPNNPIGFGNTKSSVMNQNGNIDNEIETQANSLKKALEYISNDPKTSKYMDRIFSAGDCVRSVDEASSVIDTVASVIDEAKPELKTFLTTASRIQNSSDFSQIIKASIDILRQVESLVPKFAPLNQNNCGASFPVLLETLMVVGDVLKDASEDSSLGLSKDAKEQLKISSVIVAPVTALLGDLNESSTSGKKGPMKAFRGVLQALASILENLEVTEDKEEVKEMIQLAAMITETIATIPEVDAEKPGSNVLGVLEITARILEDLTEVFGDLKFES